MKKLLSLILATMLLGSVALAESVDYASMTDEELHGIIDSARNELTKREMVFGEKTVLIDQDGVQFYLTGEYEFNASSDSKYTELETVLINNSDRKVTVTVDDLYVNGWQIFAMCGSNADAGKKDKGSLDMSLADAEVNTFEDIQDMEFMIRVYDSETYDDLFIVGPITVQF